MFSLETAIETWRHVLKNDRALSVEDLDELEQHLRDQLPWLMNKGLNEEQAFRRAIQVMGEIGSIQEAYQDVFWLKTKYQKKLSDELAWRVAMLKNYLKITVRTLIKNKTYSVINIGGLAVGMAVCVMILMFVREETSYDQYHEYSDRIYRIVRGSPQDDGTVESLYSRLAPSFVPILEDNFPEMEHVARIYQPSNLLMTYEGITFVEQGGLYAEADIFEILTIPFLDGNPGTALVEPGTIVLTSTTARRYFGGEDPMGKQIVLASEIPLQVTGIIEDPPRKTHLHFDFLVSYKSLALWGEQYKNYFLGPDNFKDNATIVYARLAPGTDAQALEARMPEMLDTQFPSFEMHNGQIVSGSEVFAIQLGRVSDIHLRLGPSSQFEAGGSISNVRILTLIAVFILIIACINFMNLSTATASRRAREVGLRKVVGADRKTLVAQFLGESLATGWLALVLAVVLLAIMLPKFGSFVGYEFSAVQLTHPTILLVLGGVFLSTSVLAGLYPAFYLSSFKPVTILRGELTRGKGGAAFRKGLVIFQFVVSITLIVCVGVIYKQMNFMKDMDLGFDKENVAMVSLDGQMRSHWEDVRARLIDNPAILDATISRRAPTGNLGDYPGFRTEVYGEVKTNSIHMPHNRVGYDFFSTYGMQIVAGRDFSRDYPADATGSFIINETAARELGWRTPEDAIGSPMLSFAPDLNGTVIGVVRDFNYESLHNLIIPVVTYIRPGSANTAAVRLAGGSVTEGLDHLKAVWNEFLPGSPVDVTFLNDRIDALYQSETRMMQISGYFSLIAVLIASLGLFGLATFMAERRTKEVGLRKIMGASEFTIMRLLSGSFVKWVLIANIIAWPIAYLAMDRWLQDFAYKAGMGIEIFILATVASLAIAVLSVLYQTSKAAKSNPVDCLRYDSA